MEKTVSSSPSNALSHKDGGRKPFRFFDLPFELRSKILCHALVVNSTIDLDPENSRTAWRRLNLFLTSHRLYDEAYRIFYSRNVFRIFPTWGRFFTGMPLPQRLPTVYRSVLVSLELRLGPGWSNPPRSWRVDDRLGFEEMLAVRTLKVFVECDPSHEVFTGFRVDKDFFTTFSSSLLEDILIRLPGLVQVELDAWQFVMREGPLMTKLIEICEKHSKKVTVKLADHDPLIKNLSWRLNRQTMILP